MRTFAVEPVVLSVLPKRFPLIDTSAEIWLVVVLTIVTVGFSMLAAWILTGVMQKKGFRTNLLTNLILTGILSLLTVVRCGFTMASVQGILLTFVLLYASCSDLTHHLMDDFLWVMVVMLGLCSVYTVGLPSMLVGAVMVLVPQMLSASLSKRSIGGADIKLSTALAFLLGWQKGLVALVLGMLLAVIVMSIVQKIRKGKRKQPFALIPFLSAAAMIVYLI